MPNTDSSLETRKSCTSQLLEVMEDWIAAIENGEPVDVIYLDFAKAFDSASTSETPQEVCLWSKSGAPELDNGLPPS